MVKKKNTDKVPSGTSEAIEPGRNPSISDGNDPVSDPDGGNQSPEEQSRHSSTPKAKSRKGIEETSNRGDNQTPNLSPECELPGTEGNLHQAPDNRIRSVSVDPGADPSVINEMLNTIFEYTEEIDSLRIMSSKAALLIEETNRANSALNDKSTGRSALS